ncbi:MAG: cupin domain-containing protein [Micrococcales bacterium]|nr:cupin domain-containing protein [Micrococcales bacterium]
MGDVVLHRAGDGPGTWAMGSLFEHLVTASQTDGLLGVSLVTQPVGTATPFHRHTHEAEAFYVLEGRVRYRAGEEVFELDPGSFVHLPRALPHAFRIVGDAPARFLALTTPGGLMDLYDEVGVPASSMHVPGPGEGRTIEDEIARWNEVGPRFGLEVVGPPIPPD